jgi:hypothetical protein
MAELARVEMVLLAYSVAPEVAARLPVLAGQAAMVAMGVAPAALVVTVAMAATVPSSMRS